jgi:hypothetical protein
VILQKPAIRDEGALDGVPSVQVFHPEQRFDQYRCEEKNKQEIQKQDHAAAREFEEQLQTEDPC